MGFIEKSDLLNSELTPYTELKKNINSILRVATFARVVDFNSDRGTITAQPLIKERIKTEEEMIEVEISPILNVPVFFFAGQTFTPATNDLCLLIHVDRSFQELINNYDKNNPETITTYGQGSSRRKHDLNDCVALVGFLSYKQAAEASF